MSDLTTLQLARRIADAVHVEFGKPMRYVVRSVNNMEDPPTQAVLRVLHETNSWFCRLEDTPHGTVQTPYEQLDLLRHDEA